MTKISSTAGEMSSAPAREQHSQAYDVAPSHVATPGRIAEVLAFFKSLRNFTGDLSTISAPIFILGPVSITEYSSYWCEQPSLFVAPATQPTRELRALAVLKWYLSTLRGQYGGRKGIASGSEGPAGRKGPGRKKPLNPILGEIFKGHWDDVDGTGRTEIVVEQVSHQPPVTACRISNAQHQIRLDSYHVQKTYFRGMPHIEKVGHLVLSLDQHGESYVMTMPTLHLEGLLPPPPHPELSGRVHIIGDNGLVAEIDFFGRGWIRGKKNSFRAELISRDQPKKTLYRIEGQWQGGQFSIFNAADTKLEEFDTADSQQIIPVTVAPISEQSRLESRRVWQHVANAIMEGDLSTAGREKNTLEEEQRALRKKEASTGELWEPQYFRVANDWKLARELLKSAGLEMARKETKGVWRWVENEQ